MENSRKKRFINFKLHTVWSSVVESCPGPFRPSGMWVIPLWCLLAVHAPAHWSLRSHLGDQISCQASQGVCSPGAYFTDRGPKCRSSGAGTSDMPTGGWAGLPASGKLGADSVRCSETERPHSRRFLLLGGICRYAITLLQWFYALLLFISFHVSFVH